MSMVAPSVTQLIAAIAPRIKAPVPDLFPGRGFRSLCDQSARGFRYHELIQYFTIVG